MSSKKQTKILFENWRAFLSEEDKEASEGGEEKVVRIYDFDGVVATFSPELKEKFFEESKVAGSKITGTEIQVKNTLALGASLLATAESAAEKYVEITKPVAPYYVISKFSNPSYIFKVPYYDDLRAFLEKSGLDLREAPNAVPTKKATIIKSFLKRTGTDSASGVMMADNTEGNSKLNKASEIGSKHKGENVKFMVYAANTKDGKKEATMIKSGLTESGIPEEKVEIIYTGSE